MDLTRKTLALLLCAALMLALSLPALADGDVFDVTGGVVEDVTDESAVTGDGPAPEAEAVEDVIADGAAEAAAVGDVTGGMPLELTPVDPATLGVRRLSELTRNADVILSGPDAEETDRDPSESVYVLIYLDGDSAIAAGYPVEGIGENAAADAYRESLAAAQDAVAAAIESAVGYDIGVDWSFTLLFNALSATIRYGDIAVVEAAPGVRSVEIQEALVPGETLDEEETDTVQTAVTAVTTGADTVWAQGYTGAGSRIAIIDTGLDTDHEAVDGGAFEYALAQLKESFGYSYDLLDAEELSGLVPQLNAADLNATASNVYVSEKIPFAFNYCDRNTNVGHTSDSQGNHGSHIAGIAAANRYVPSQQSETGYAAASAVGMAPDAQLIIMKVFGSTAARSGMPVTYMAALEDAVALGCDAINMSLGSYYPGFGFGTDTLTAFNKLAECGVVVTISCGNSYAWNGRGSNTGSAYIYADDVSMDTVTRPASFRDSLSVASSAKSESTATTAENLSMSAFSSRGVPGTLTLKPELTAPGGSISSISGRTSSTGAMNAYTTKSGTSMAAPHVAGLAAILAQMFRENDLTESTGRTSRQLANSLLMSTAVPLVSDGSYVSLLRQGAGIVQISAAAAAKSYIWMGSDATDSYADGKVKAELGQDAARAGVYSFSFSVNNMTGERLAYSLSADLFTQGLYSTDGTAYMAESTTGIDAAVTFSTGSSVTVPANGSASVTVTITLTDAQKAWFDENFKTAYIEGFVWARCGDEAHSIPILGAYGSWTDSSMFDTASLLDTYYEKEYDLPYSGSADTNAVYITYAGGSGSILYTGNDYIKEDAFPADRLAMRSDTTISAISYTLIRNAAAVGWAVTGADGTALSLGALSDNVLGMYYAYYSSANRMWLNKDASSVSPSVTVSSLGLGENESFTVGLYAIPEYYAAELSGGTTGRLTEDGFKTLLASSGTRTALGEGAYIGCTVTVDDTAPTIEGAVLNEDGTITITISENQYLACLELYDADNATLAALVPEQTAAGENVVYTFDPEAVSATDCKYYIFAADYACNETAAAFSFHSYRANWSWNDDYTAASVSLVCTSCGDTQTPSVTVTPAITPAACETDGLAVYTASAVYDGVTYTDARRFASAATGHSYAGPAWSWADDHTSAQAAFTCSACGDTKTVSSSPTVSVTTAATCTAAGEADCTASVSFGGASHSDTQAVTLPALGHDYSASWTWAENSLSATVTLICLRCGGTYTATVDAAADDDVVSDVVESAGLSDGEAVYAASAVSVIEEVAESTDLLESQTVYTATVTVDGVAYTCERVVVVPAEGHTWAQPGWTWAADHASATAAFACESGTVSVDAAVTGGVTAAATCTEAGASVYTASVVFGGTVYTDRYETAVPATGHSLLLTGWTWAEDHASAQAAFTCSVCGGTTDVAADITSAVTPATYIADGSTVYTAAAALDGRTYTDTSSVVLAKKTIKHSLVLDGNIGVNFYMSDLNEADASNAKAVLSIDGATLSEAELSLGAGGYYARGYVVAKQMTERITLDLYVDGSLAASESFSVADYAALAFAQQKDLKEELVTLCKAMMYYGSCAQTFFGYNTGSLPSGGELLGEVSEPKTIGVEFDKDALNEKLAVWGMTYVGANLKLDTNTTLLLNFQCTGSSYKELTVTVDGSPAAFETKNGYQVIRIDEIASKKIGDTHTYVLSDGTNTVEFRFCVYNYVSTALQSDKVSAELKKLCTAIYNYCEAAKDYFKYTST